MVYRHIHQPARQQPRQRWRREMGTYTIECGGFTGSQLPNVAAVQAWIDGMKARFSLVGEEVRVYRFVDGKCSGKPELIGKVS